MIRKTNVKFFHSAISSVQRSAAQVHGMCARVPAGCACVHRDTSRRGAVAARNCRGFNLRPLKPVLPLRRASRNPVIKKTGAQNPFFFYADPKAKRSIHFYWKGKRKRR